MRGGHPSLRRGPLTLGTYLALPHLLVSFHGEPYGPVDQALAWDIFHGSNPCLPSP